MIAKSTRKVLNGLKRKGYDVYLVGGCVRDLILKRTPRDFDIITSAELKEVMKTFSWCTIIGKRFPICMFTWMVPLWRFRVLVLLAGGSRDFTINGLMFDPYTRTVYDYIGGIEDIRKSKVRSINPATTSFKEDCARILCGIRIAARLGFGISKETARSVKKNYLSQY
ncbi:Poly A polymerase [Quillaja saponaria]|nr:Poly A polymerase [Quillaja saponaria]